MFIETYRRSSFGRPVVEIGVLQVNVTESRRGAVGLHYHLHQAELLVRPAGSAVGACTTCDKGRPTRGVVETVDLRDTGVQRVHPAGVAHGFAGAHRHDASPTCVDGYYNPADELGVAVDDPRRPPTGASPSRSCPTATTSPDLAPSDRDRRRRSPSRPER